MRYLILPAVLACLLAAAGAGAQTRRIAAASHSGAATAQDLDNFGLDLEYHRQMRQRYDSVRRADSMRQATDSARRRIRPKQRQKPQ